MSSCETQRVTQFKLIDTAFISKQLNYLVILHLMHAHYKVQEYRKHFLQSKCEKCAYRKSMPRPATRRHNVLYSIKLQQV